MKYMFNFLFHCGGKDRSKRGLVFGGVSFFVFLVCAGLMGGTRISYADPFSLEQGEWKSLDQFVEDNKKGSPTEKDEQPQPVATSPAAKQAVADLPSAPKVVAAPDRAIHIPVMPSEATDALPQSSAKAADNGANGSENGSERKFDQAGSVADKNWETIEQQKQEEQAAGKPPLPVRLVGLPSERSKPVADAVIKPKKAAAPKQAPAPKASKEACDALASSRQKQLAAIESDKRTLAALQAAIAELGLSKKLSFTPRSQTADLNPSSRAASGADSSGAKEPEAKK
jgi:hypothetical protein